MRRKERKDGKEGKCKFVRECPTKKKIIINFSAKKIKNIYYTDYFNVRAPLVNQAKKQNKNSEKKNKNKKSARRE